MEEEAAPKQGVVIYRNRFEQDQDAYWHSPEGENAIAFIFCLILLLLCVAGIWNLCSAARTAWRKRKR